MYAIVLTFRKQNSEKFSKADEKLEVGCCYP